ncbi:uncharacterized protein LOC126593908 [Malus sylvestris]|uniref:uncharacterized protein LOC126593908 n=1 Tax=Malus sylvestris TaxID=3752 RepID=UPI0021ABD0F3|nr:uncharacterized protein LOC126593908 [Malus sylvestris]
MISKEEEREKDILEALLKVQSNIPILGTTNQVPECVELFNELCTTRRMIQEKEVAEEYQEFIKEDVRQPTLKKLDFMTQDKSQPSYQIWLSAKFLKLSKKWCLFLSSCQSTQVLRVITSEEHKLQEAMVGLAVSILVFLFPEESRLMFKKAGITEGEVVQILKKYMHPPFKVSRIRRFAIELAICMMRDKPKNVRVFRDLGMEKELEFVLETTAELDIFNIFSSTVGMSHHSTMIHSLVKTALGLQDGMKQHNAVFIKFITYVEIKIIL